jgi:hypothetical protein
MNLFGPVLELESLEREGAFLPLPKAILGQPANSSNNSRERDGVKSRPCMDSMHAALPADGVSQWWLVVLELSEPKAQFWGVTSFRHSPLALHAQSCSR